jgi:hypothetical protein
VQAEDGRSTNLELDLLQFFVEVLCQQIPRQILDFEPLCRLHLEPLALLLNFALEEVDMGVKICLERVCFDREGKNTHFEWLEERAMANQGG